ncbi:unnamed protein product [Hymenolepis diminuta]|uniref:Uncharacterized protein n=1 Tax=Hymenolepis diminuta TaxID=6216 RepID=A0A564YX13_HYMDI|nr:unnamed protein product [Hymenolepis diminuta]
MNREQETFSSRLNSRFERSDFQDNSNKELKCPLYLCGFKSAEVGDVPYDLLSRIERGPNITILDVVIQRHRIEKIENIAFIQKDL